MGQLNFEEESISSRQITKRNSKIVDRIISTGIAKDAKQATYILYGLLAVTLIITFFTLRSMGSPDFSDEGTDPNVDPDTGELYSDM